MASHAEAVSALLSLLIDSVNIVDGTIAVGVGQGATVSFIYTNPVDGKQKTATGITLTVCPPSKITAFRTTDNKWYVVGQQFAQPVRERVLQLRQKRPSDPIELRAFVGYLYTQQLQQDTPVLCGAPPPGTPHDPEDDLPPIDPDYPRPDRSYAKTWVNDYGTRYPTEVERWLFGQDNCQLTYSQSPGASSLGWLPDPPNEAFYEGLYVSTFLPYVHTLYEQPNLNAKTWTGYTQFIGSQASGSFNDILSISGIVQTFLGDSAPEQPPSLWVYLGAAAGFYDFTAGKTYRVLANAANKTCAPRLPAAPQPPTPPPPPPGTGDRKSYALWYAASNLKAPIKLKTLSEQETRGKGDIVYRNARETLVLLKYGDARNDGAPNTIDRGYCRLSIFKIPGDSGTPFTEIAMTWSIAQAGGAFSALLELGLGGHPFFQHLVSLSFYADDTIGYLGGQTNPLYDRWIKADLLKPRLKTCGSRHLRNLANVTAKPRVYVPDLYPKDTNPNAKDWRGESIYSQALFAELKSKGTVKLTLQALELIPNPFYDQNQPEGATNLPYVFLVFKPLSLKNFQLKLKLAANESLVTIVCAPLDPRSLR